jgi:repressor LexA
MDSSKTIASSSLPLTDRQQKVLDWIRRHLESTGMPPTRAEIAAGLGFSTASSAEDHLRALARKGALELTPGASRGLRLKDMPELPGMRWASGSSRALAQAQGLPSGLLPGLPVVGRVAAGSPVLATEHIEAHVRVDPALFAPRADYLLRVRGQSMRDAGILDGDLLAVHRTADARSGQIVVARLSGAGGDEVTVKRLKRRGRELMLVAENPDFAPIVIDPKRATLTIEGIAVGLVRGGKGW